MSNVNLFEYGASIVLCTVAKYMDTPVPFMLAELARPEIPWALILRERGTLHWNANIFQIIEQNYCAFMIDFNKDCSKI